MYTLKQIRRMFFEIKVNHLSELETIPVSIGFRDRTQTLKTLQETRNFSMLDITC